MASGTYDLKKIGRLATIKNPKSYGDWLKESSLGTKIQTSGTSAATERRSAYGYGSSGEKMARSTLANDGYAAYLREAAKRQREERNSATGSESLKSQQAALAGYADYLRGLRRADAARLTDAANEIVGLGSRDTALAEEIANRTSPTAEQKTALLDIYKSATTPGQNASRSEIVAYMSKEKLTYREAYDYCRSLGYNASTAKSMASSAVNSLDDTTRKMYELFGYN